MTKNRRKKGVVPLLITSITLSPLLISVVNQEAIAASYSQVGQYRLVGAIGALYNSNPSLKNEAGSPISQEMPAAQRGAKQHFQRGTIYWTGQTGAVWWRNGGLKNFYGAVGGENSYLGYPVTSVYANGMPDNGFQIDTYNPSTRRSYSIVWSNSYGAKVIYRNGAIGSLWNSNKNYYGAPRTHEICESNGVCWQSFENYDIVWTEKYGARIMTHSGTYYSLMNSYGGYRGKIGGPSSNIQWFTNRWGWGTTQSFYNPSTGARHKLVFHRDLGIRIVYENGAIGGLWNSIGAYNSFLGVPTTNEEGGLYNGGAWQKFEGGTIFWTERTGAHSVDWDNWNIWSQYNREGGALGYPISSKYSTSSGSRQDFEGGYIENGKVTLLEKYSNSLMDSKAVTAFGVASKPMNSEWSPLADRNIIAKKYTTGMVVFSPQYGYVAMSQEVFNHWVNQKRYSDFSNFAGLPTSEKWVNGKLHTFFENNELYYDSSNNLVRSNKNLGKNNAVVIGDSQVWDNSWVGIAVKQNGYTPDFYRCGGVGFVSSREGVCPSYYQGVIDNVWALPNGNPGVIYIAASGNDSWQSNGTIENNQQKTIEKLKKIYPNSTIVVQGVVSNRDSTHSRRWELDDQARRLAQRNGLKFISPKYMNTDFGLNKYLADGIHYQDRYQATVASYYTPKLRELLTRDISSINVSY